LGEDLGRVRHLDVDVDEAKKWSLRRRNARIPRRPRALVFSQSHQAGTERRRAFFNGRWHY
jgi:hypothetical protein